MVEGDFKEESASEAFHSSRNKLSPYLRFGCLSPRTFYDALFQRYQTVCVILLVNVISVV